MNKKKAQNRFVFACLAPAVILVFIFMVIPTIDVFKTAFFKKSNFVSDATFAGFFNFKVLFNDMRFIEAMQIQDCIYHDHHFGVGRIVCDIINS